MVQVLVLVFVHHLLLEAPKARADLGNVKIRGVLSLVVGALLAVDFGPVLALHAPVVFFHVFGGGLANFSRGFFKFFKCFAYEVLFIGLAEVSI